MLASITPLGERSRRQRWPVTVTSLIAGAVLAGGVVGAALGALGAVMPVAPAARLEVVLALVLLGVVFDVRLVGIGLPTHRRQVDDAWLRRYRGWVYGFGFGAQLGIGVVTIVTTSAVYVTLATEVLALDVRGGCLIGATFGFVRGVTVLAGARVDSPTRLAAFHRRFYRLERTAARTAVVAQALVVAAAAATL